MGKNTYPFTIRNSTPEYAVKLRQLKYAHVNAELEKIRESKRSTTQITPVPYKNLVIPDNLLPFVTDGPLFSSSGKLLETINGAYLNRLRDLKKQAAAQAEQHKITEINDLTRFQDIYHRKMSGLLTSIRELGESSSDTDSSSANQSWQSLKRARLAKKLSNFKLPFVSVIDVNQPHHTNNQNQHARMDNPSLKRKTPCPEYMSDSDL
ncbi:unnamed protein product [Rhizophagus irregularis]|nr:unnamed protein product [Rhizophagus irregularis]